MANSSEHPDGSSSGGDLVPRSKRSAVPGPAAAVGLAKRLNATARNVAEVVRFGGLQTDEEASPFTVVAEQLNYRLRHYFADSVPADAPPIVLVPPLMLTTEVWDVAPTSSAVAALHAEGLDTWVVDFGNPDAEPGGLERTLEDHVLAVSDAVDRVTAATGQDVILSGYSQGGMFVYQAAAYRRGEGIDSLVTFGSPVDGRAPLPIPLSTEAATRLANGLIESGLLHKLALPGWASRLGFKLLTPAKSVQGRIDFLMALHDRDALLPRERQRRFLESDGWTAWSGPAIADILEMFVLHNRMIEGGFVIDERLVTLADVEMPILTFVGSSDTIGHPDSVRAIRRAAPRSKVYETTLRAGHFGLVVGSTATTSTWPAVGEWARWRYGGAPLPASIVPAEQVEARPLSVGAGMAALMQAAELSIGAGRIVVGTARRVAHSAQGLVSQAPAQLPRLARIEQLDPSTRISLGQLLEEQARKTPEEICFLFGDRAIRQTEVKHRVDSVVKGLISIGIRHGDRVGVLMDTRPSAFTLVAALSRLGATAVLLRPDGEIDREARLGRITWLVSDPEHVDRAGELPDVRWCVLGGGASSRELPEGVLDMERIDPDTVDVPAWYSPNPHRAGDTAFVVFTGEGTGTKATLISNRRWALSALGTAAAAALKPGDTVYSVTPIHHSSALLMSVGGAVASGARFAMASGSDPATFWTEVRRYGVSHVSYTWTSLRDITFADPNPSERYNPIRMFIGSGMPRNLWTRVAERFPDARILEFYASAEGEAILANLTGQKPGSMGKPLPGTAEVRVAAFDLVTRQLELTSDGLAREALSDEVGLLLSRVNPNESPGSPLRSVFQADDAWRSSNDLFLRDDQGDHWLAGPISEIVDTPRGPVLPSGARFCLGSIPAADLVVAYGVPEDGSSLLVAALTLRPGATVTAADLDKALERLPRFQRPTYVQVVASLPVTTWHRPVWRELQKRGVPKPGRNRQVWQLDPSTGHYAAL
ncbi:alpha/beta fold hydrolase [Jatrophihabitans sp.]|uniref:alpha/beta fold hydrolase n=1 Tax=Jatrophihabitans sp. TaxID=1932789 RepID=UPI0030C6BE6A|nr:acyl-CoA ligase/synthetase [Jatrophihabitans sp.]